MEIKDMREPVCEEIEVGDIVRGESGTYYMFIQAGWSQYNMLDLEDFSLFSPTKHYNSIGAILAILSRDEKKTHIKNNKVEVILR